MTIKAKLIANMLVITAIIAGISLACFSSMRFLQEKLSYIAEKSTPFQMRTVEFQRELQNCITDLVKVNSARNMSEYARFRGEAEKSLGDVNRSRQALEKMYSGSRMDASDEFSQISGELFVSTEARITGENAASAANTKISQQMKESSTRLKELESHIRNLQVTRAASFAKALENTDRFSASLRDLEDLRNQVKELLAVSGSAHNARNATAFLIEQGKVKTLLKRISRNLNGKYISPEIKALADDTHEFLKLQAVAISQKDSESKKWETESFNELAENINRIVLTLNQEIELASSKLTIETHRQGAIFAQSNSANSILLANSELVALSLAVTGEINRLFAVGSPVELERYNSEILSLFTTIHNHILRMESSLARLEATDELKMLRAAHTSLEVIRSQIHSADGIVAILKRKLNSVEQANRSADKLRDIVIRQTAKGKESVSVAQVEQEKAIAAVNNMVLRSKSRIIGISSVAIIVGGLFGFWIYRSILLPLRIVLGAVSRQKEQAGEKARLAEAVAGGDLTQTVTVGEAMALDTARTKNDEMGMVLSAVAGMSEAQITLDRAFAGMTASLRSSRDEEVRRNRLKSGLYELNYILRSEQNTAEMADKALAYVTDFIGAGVGIMYLYDEEGEMLQTLSTYAISRSARLNWGFRLGEGLPGQAALERKMIHLTTVPPDYLPITSALGGADPIGVVILPIVHNDTMVGVLELGSFRQFGGDEFDFLNLALEGIAIAINANSSRQRVNELLEQAEAQAEELRVQQEELQQANEELEERARMLAEQRNYNIY
jgi:methyl-accepting chemotaxis protein